MTLTHLSDALDDICQLERGTVTEPIVLPGVACLVCPPQDVRDTVALRLLVQDPQRMFQPGCRVVHSGQRYVVTQLSTDPDGLTELQCKDFNEPAY